MLKSLEEGRRTHSVDQWVEWLTRIALEDKVPNIDRLIAVFLTSKYDDVNPDPSIKSLSFTYNIYYNIRAFHQYHRLQSSSWTAHLRVTGHISTGYEPKSSWLGGGILL